MKLNWVIQYRYNCYFVGLYDKKEISGITVSSCYLAYSNNKENSTYFQSRSNMVLSVYHNKFFVRMLKYV